MKLKSYITLLLIFSTILGFSQEKVADNFFRDYAYKQAIELYKEVLAKKDTTEHILKRLGDCYFNNSEVEEASYWYKKAIKKYPKINTDYIYKYAQTLRGLKKYDEANKYLKIFSERNKRDKRIKNIESLSLEVYDSLSNTDKVNVDIKNLPLNTKYSDFGGYEFNDLIYFYSTWTKDSITKENKLYKWNKEPFLNVFQSKTEIKNGKKLFGDFKKISSQNINTDAHEGLVTITSNGKTMYFTRNNVNKRSKIKYSKKGTSHLKIFKAEFVDNKWTNIKELPFNNNTYSCGSPALSPDDKTLFFVSDMEDGFGQTDIYKVAINNDGTYGAPKNLGPKINTEGNEKFPFVAKDSTFYFSSDAHINLGLLDIFESNILKKGEKEKEIEIKNLGAPYNSSFDDFCFFINTETQSGYFSSNRAGGIGGDDIYTFKRYDCKQKIKGIVRDKLTNEPLEKVYVKLLDINGKIVEEVTTLDDGKYKFTMLGCHQTYTVLAERVIYRPDNKSFVTSPINEEETEIDLYLQPLIIDNEIIINPIYFDFNKSKIRPDAAYELENIVAVMREHPKIVIKIEAHSDSRGRDAYNAKLSDRRAKSTRDYLFSRGITTNRIESAIGYGESQLINNCGNDVKCSEAEHQQNRRSKFIITRGYK